MSAVADDMNKKIEKMLAETIELRGRVLLRYASGEPNSIVSDDAEAVEQIKQLIQCAEYILTHYERKATK